MRDFSKTTLAKLAQRGITVLCAQSAPAFDGDETFSGRVYQIVEDGFVSRWRSVAEHWIFAIMHRRIPESLTRSRSPWALIRRRFSAP